MYTSVCFCKWMYTFHHPYICDSIWQYVVVSSLMGTDFGQFCKRPENTDILSYNCSGGTSPVNREELNSVRCDIRNAMVTYIRGLYRDYFLRLKVGEKFYFSAKNL